jgi:hypothetical protein
MKSSASSSVAPIATPERQRARIAEIIRTYLIVASMTFLNTKPKIA